MRRFLRLGLGFLLALVLFFGNVSAGPLTEHDVKEVQAAKVKLSKTKLSLYVKKTATLKLKGAKKVTWSSSNKKVATVTKKGKVTAVKKGTATITAKAGKKKYKCKVTVLNPTLSKTSLTLYAGDQATLSAKNAVGTVSWASANKAIATVSAKGVVKGVAKGTTTITAKASGVKLTCKVTVKQGVEDLALAAESKRLYVGETFDLDPQVLPENADDKAYTVTCDREDVVTFTDDGQGKVQLTAKAVGQAVITVITNHNSIEKTCTVDVVILPEGIALDKDQATLYEGETVSLKAAVSPEETTDKGVTWTSDNEQIAKVDQDGTVTAVAAGTAKITATSKDITREGQHLTAQATITVKKAVQDVTIAAASKTIKINETFDLNPTVIPADATDPSFTVSSSDENVAAVDAKGLVTARKDGTAVITVTANDRDIVKTCQITVKTELESLTTGQDRMTLDVGDSASYDYQVGPEGVVTTASFASSDPSVASVSDQGVIKGLKSGTAQITLTVKDNYANERAAVMTVTVIQHVESIALSSNAETLYLEGTPYTIRTLVLPADANDKSLAYVSSAPEIAAVSEDGVVTPVAEGEATITVSSKDVPSVKAELKITVKDASSTTAIVSSEEELTAALAREGIEVVTIQTEESVNITIPEGDYTGISLIIDAPNGHIVNYGRFKDVTIKAISAGTYVEHADNIINYAAATGSVEIAQDANATIIVIEGAQSLKLINNGSVTSLTVTTPDTDITITGQSSQLFMPVDVTSGATGTDLSTSRDLDVNADTKIHLDIRAGGETTSVTVNTEESIPSITGLGRIEVLISDTRILENIVAEHSDQQGETASYNISGNIVDVEGDALDGVSIYLLPYRSGITVDEIDVQTAIQTAVSADGSYRMEDVQAGNYYIYIAESGYTPVLDTLILYNESHGQGKNYTLVKKAEGEIRGTIQGSLTDAQTGEPVEEGLTIYLRSGLNNISGSYIAYTHTDSQGAFTFDEIPLGQYTVQAVDQRENEEAYYVSNSFNVTVSGEGNNPANGTLTKVLTSDQVRFVLTWGDEESGASRDLDSHLVGPRVGGEGKFHVYYSNKVYGEGYEDEDGYQDDYVRYVDLDVDDTTWVGPETTTIYVKENGTYSFYIYDYTNGGCGTQLRRSSAVVKAYIGSKLMATYNCPDKDGGLWYVCDYDSRTNKFVTKNIVSDFEEGSGNVGIDLLDKYQGLLDQAIKDTEAVLAQNPDLADMISGTTIDQAKDILKNSEDYSQLKEQYQILNEFLEGLSEGLYIDSVSMYDAEGNNMLNYWETEWDDDDNRILYLNGYLPQISDLTVTVDEESAWELIASDLDGYEKAVKVTNRYGISRNYYIWYTYVDSLGIDEVSSYYTDEYGDEYNRIEDWDTETVGDEEIRQLILYGTAEEMPEDLTVIGYPNAAKVEITDSDKAAYQKMVTLSYADISTTYYIVYRLYRALNINSVQALDPEGNDLIYGWDWGKYWEYDDETDEEYYYYGLDIYGYASDLPDNLEISGYYDFITPEIKASDRDGYDKMVVFTYGDESRTYYIKYYFDPDLSIDSVTAADQDGNSVIDDWDTETRWRYDEEEDEDYFDCYCLEIYGYVQNFPDNLTIKGRSSLVTSQIKDSDRDDFDKMVTLSYGDVSRTYYIEYHLYRATRIRTIQALDADGNDLISDWEWDEHWYYDDETDDEYIDYYYLDIYGYASDLPDNLEISGYYDFITPEIKDSDRDDFVKMVVFSYGDESRTYYIRYYSESYDYDDDDYEGDIEDDSYLAQPPADTGDSDNGLEAIEEPAAGDTSDQDLESEGDQGFTDDLEVVEETSDEAVQADAEETTTEDSDVEVIEDAEDAEVIDGE